MESCCSIERLSLLFLGLIGAVGSDQPGSGQVLHRPGKLNIPVDSFIDWSVNGRVQNTVVQVWNNYHVMNFRIQLMDGMV